MCWNYYVRISGIGQNSGRREGKRSINANFAAKGRDEIVQEGTGGEELKVG